MRCEVGGTRCPLSPNPGVKPKKINLDSDDTFVFVYPKHLWKITWNDSNINLGNAAGAQRVTR